MTHLSARLAGALVAAVLVAGYTSVQGAPARSVVESTGELAANQSLDDTQEAPWAESPDSNEIVIMGQRITKPPLSAGLEGSLGDDMVTTDKGAGVRCTTMHTGRSICTRPADPPGSVGVQTNWSDWTF
jgi:hypothetical protein